jgi:hypothetical protein
MTHTAGNGFKLRELENVRPLRALRVLLVGRDARYLRAIEFLLGGRGYETRRLSNPARLAATATSFAADIVILDGGASFADAARQAAALVATTERVGVVVAAPRPAPVGSARLRFVEKWTSFEAVLEAVEGAWAELEAVPRSEPERRASAKS